MVDEVNNEGGTAAGGNNLGGEHAGGEPKGSKRAGSEGAVGEGAPSGWIVLALGNSFGQPIVLLHGFMQDEHSWDASAQAMASSYYLSMPRMSAVSAETATLDALVDGVYGVVQQAILHTGCSRVVLMGYSMGGRVALNYMRRYPETVSTLVLESAGIGPVDEADRERMRQVNFSMAERIRQAASMDEVVDYWEQRPLFDSQAELPEEARESLRKMRQARNPEELALLLEHAGAHHRPLAVCQEHLLKTGGSHLGAGFVHHVPPEHESRRGVIREVVHSLPFAGALSG